MSTSFATRNKVQSLDRALEILRLLGSEPERAHYAGIFTLANLLHRIRPDQGRGTLVQSLHCLPLSFAVVVTFFILNSCTPFGGYLLR